MAAIMAASGVMAGAAQEGRVEEYELKAAILYNLTKFVEWPDSVYTDGRAPTVLCILGRNPFGNSLARQLTVRHLESLEAARACQVLYISSSERTYLHQILVAVKGAGVLTVGETSQFAGQGGMVQFTLENKRVQFDINLSAVSRERLKISARLLALARIIREESRGLTPTTKPEATERLDLSLQA
jgi:hypothetical protein